MGSRVTMGAARNAHSAPLLKQLKLDLLSDRPYCHVISIVNSIPNRTSHPSLWGMFRSPGGELVENDQLPKTGIGKRRFSIFAKGMFNAAL